PLGSGRTVADRATVQARVAEAEAGLRAAHALTEQAVAAAWVDAEAGGQARTEQRLGLRLSATHAVRTAARVADACHDLGGGSAIYASSPLQRRLRDAQTATAHAQVAPATWELTGRLLLDRATDIAQL
uniref:acyl-CoA dehydrogenase family protein n=1 Tax=Paraconexibacter sp. TaxID=2949640 RepID=UPI003568BB85